MNVTSHLARVESRRRHDGDCLPADRRVGLIGVQRPAAAESAAARRRRWRAASVVHRQTQCLSTDFRQIIYR